MSSIQSDDIPSSQFENYSQSTTEDILSDNMFSNNDTSPLQAIHKRREEEIAAKDVEENRKIEELRQQAKTDIENWYNERQRQMEQRRQMKTNEYDLNTRSSENNSKILCNWSDVIRLINFTDGKQVTKSKRDLTRMKACIFNAQRINEKKKLLNGI